MTGVQTCALPIYPDWIKEKKAPILYQAALTRHPLLPHVPTLAELGLTPDGKAVLTAIAATAEIGRSIVTTPNVPPARLAALRKAFNDMVADPAFLETMSRRNVMIEPLTGEQVDKISKDTLETPKPVLKLVQELATVK